MTMPPQFQPITDSDTSRVNIEMVPGTTIEQTEAVADQVTAIARGAARSRPRRSRASTKATARLFVVLKEDRDDRRAIEFERAAGARAAEDSRRAGDLRLAERRRHRPRHLGHADRLRPRRAERRPRKRWSSRWRACPTRRRAAHRRRHAAARAGDHAAARPRRAARRDHQRAEPGDPHRHARRDRPERGQVLAVATARSRSASCSPRPRARTSRRSRTCRCRPPPAARCRSSASPTSASAPGRRRSSASTRRGASSSAPISRPGVVSGPAMHAINAAADHEEPAGRRVEQAGRRREMAGRADQNFIIAVIAGILLVFAVLVLLYRRFVSPLVNMASLLLAPLGGLLALLAARPAAVDAGLHRPADAARHRRQELDPADRFRDRGDGRAGCPRGRRSSTPGTSARSRS